MVCFWLPCFWLPCCRQPEHASSRGCLPSVPRLFHFRHYFVTHSWTLAVSRTACTLAPKPRSRLGLARHPQTFLAGACAQCTGQRVGLLAAEPSRQQRQRRRVAGGVRHSISPNRCSQPALGQQLVRMEPEPEHLVAGEGAAAAGQEVGQQAWQAAPAQRCPASSLCRRLLAARCLVTEPHSLVPTLPVPCHPAGPALQQLWRGQAALPATPVAPPPPHRRAPV